MNTRWSSRLSHFICGCFSVCLQQWQMQFVLSVSFERCIRQNAPHTQLCLVNLVFSQLIVSQLDGSSKKGKFARVSLACSSAPQLPRKHRRRSAPQHGSRLSLSASSKTHRSVGPMLLIVGEAAQLCSRQVSPFFQRVIANFSLSGRVQHTAVRPSGSVNVSELTGPLQGPSTKSEQRRVRKRSARTESSELWAGHLIWPCAEHGIYCNVIGINIFQFGALFVYRQTVYICNRLHVMIRYVQ